MEIGSDELLFDIRMLYCTYVSVESRGKDHSSHEEVVAHVILSVHCTEINGN